METDGKLTGRARKSSQNATRGATDSKEGNAPLGLSNDARDSSAVLKRAIKDATTRVRVSRTVSDQAEEALFNRQRETPTRGGRTTVTENGR